MIGQSPRRCFILVSAVLVLFASAPLQAQARATCGDLDYNDASYTVCTVDVRKDELRLFWRNASGRPFETFAELASSLAGRHETLIFAMNAGMFQVDHSPLGLYVEGGRTRHGVNTREGSGNFHLKPNGVFFFGEDGAGVMETQRFLDSGLHPEFATQSGPMLVIDGAIHPKIQADGTSRKIRNGVGVRGSSVVIFAISRDAVTFHQFASLFRDKLDCPNALFLDGTISSLYAPDLGRTAQLLPLGPMVGAIEKTP